MSEEAEAQGHKLGLWRSDSHARRLLPAPSQIGALSCSYSLFPSWDLVGHTMASPWTLTEEHAAMVVIAFTGVRIYFGPQKCPSNLGFSHRERVFSQGLCFDFCSLDNPILPPGLRS